MKLNLKKMVEYDWMDKNFIISYWRTNWAHQIWVTLNEGNGFCTVIEHRKFIKLEKMINWIVNGNLDYSQMIINKK